MGGSKRKITNEFSRLSAGLQHVERVAPLLKCLFVCLFFGVVKLNAVY